MISISLPLNINYIVEKNFSYMLKKQNLYANIIYRCKQRRNIKWQKNVMIQEEFLQRLWLLS